MVEHKKHLPVWNFSVKQDHIPSRCNACLESDRVRHQVGRGRSPVKRMSFGLEEAAGINVYGILVIDL